MAAAAASPTERQLATEVYDANFGRDDSRLCADRAKNMG